MCINTAACLFAGRFGLAPTVNKNYGGADSYGKMVEAERPRVQSRDPAGFTIVDVSARRRRASSEPPSRGKKDFFFDAE